MSTANQRDRKFPYPLDAVVPNQTGVADDFETSIEAPFDCVIDRVILDFIPGTQQAVGVRVGTGEEWWVPRGGEKEINGDTTDANFISLSVFTEFDIGVSLSKGDQIVAQFVNNDLNNDHYLPVAVVLEEQGGT